MDENINNFRLIGQINHQSERLSHAASPRKVGPQNGIKATVAAQYQNPVRGFSMKNPLRPVTVFELQFTGQINMSGHRTDPTHF